MPSVNLRQLRDTRQLKAWIKAGETVIVKDRDVEFARMIPSQPKKQKPDWQALIARRDAHFGDQIVPGADLLIEERESYEY